MPAATANPRRGAHEKSPPCAAMCGRPLRAAASAGHRLPGQPQPTSGDLPLLGWTRTSGPACGHAAEGTAPSRCTGGTGHRTRQSRVLPWCDRKVAAVVGNRPHNWQRSGDVEVELFTSPRFFCDDLWQQPSRARYAEEPHPCQRHAQLAFGSLQTERHRGGTEALLHLTANKAHARGHRPSWEVSGPRLRFRPCVQFEPQRAAACRAGSAEADCQAFGSHGLRGTSLDPTMVDSVPAQPVKPLYCCGETVVVRSQNTLVQREATHGAVSVISR